MGGGRNTLAAARVAFALMAPAVAGCAHSPRAPISEICIPPSASLWGARERVETAMGRINELQGILLDRLRKVEGEVQELGLSLAYSRQPLRYWLDTGMPNAEGMLMGFKESLDMLREGILEAGEDAGRMRELAQRACASREFAEISFVSAMDLLDMVSAEIRAVEKE